MEHSFLQPPYVMHEVNGQALKFYPTSIGMVFKLKGLVGPLSHAMAVLFTKNETDRATKFMRDGRQDGEVHEVEAIDPRLAGQRSVERQRALDQLVSALTDKQNGLTVAELVLDSIREREDPLPDSKAVNKFLGQLTLPIAKDLLMGVAKANADVFGPLGQRVRSAVDKALQNANQNANELLGESNKPPSKSDDSSPSEGGESSKTP